MEAETLILERDSLHHMSASDCTVKPVKYGQLVNWAAKLVKSGQKVKDWSKERGLSLNIDIFRYICKFGLQIKNGLLRKLMQILFVNNLLDIFK